MSGHNGGKVALLTGDGSGIGRAAALAFVGSGAAVVIADAGGKQRSRWSTSVVVRGLFVHTDVAQAREVEQLLARTVNVFGGLHHGCEPRSSRCSRTVEVRS